MSESRETVVEPQVESEFDDLDVDAPRVGIVMGSKSDMQAMQAAAEELRKRDIHHEVRVMSAHRDPDVVADYAAARRSLGIVPQELVFDPFFSVRETLVIQSGYFGVRNNGAWIDELLAGLGLAAVAAVLIAL